MDRKDKRILIDMDGVVADYYTQFLKSWKEFYPNRPIVPSEKRIEFRIEKLYASEFEEDIQNIHRRKGFYLHMPPIQGGREALENMAREGMQVFFCTSPKTTNPYCASEKFEWVAQHFGQEWRRRIIMLKDKTLVRGDILIDDKPVITGAEIPSWEHIHYAHPYNEGLSNRRLTWDNWREFLQSLKPHKYF